MGKVLTINPSMFLVLMNPQLPYAVSIKILIAYICSIEILWRILKSLKGHINTCIEYKIPETHTNKNFQELC